MSVAVVVTCFNYSRYLDKCIESVRAQTYKEIELLVVDDGSTDDTLQLCRNLSVNYVSIPNGGLSRARNIGIRHTKSDLVMCLDADDRIPPISVECHAAIAGRGLIAQLGLKEFGESEKARFGAKVGLKELLLNNTIFCNAVFHRDDWLKVGGYDESDTMRLGFEDWEFWIRMVAAGCIIKTLPVVGLNYRVHSESMTRSVTVHNSGDLLKYIRTKHADLYKELGL
jgi:GT2 family glycosyltransferase